MNPIEEDWQKKGSASFLRWDLWAFWGGQNKTSATATAACDSAPLSALPQASQRKPWRKPPLHTEGQEKDVCTSEWIFEASLLVILENRDRLLITQKRPNYENRKKSRLINLDHWKTKEALTAVVSN